MDEVEAVGGLKHDALGLLQLLGADALQAVAAGLVLVHVSVLLLQLVHRLVRNLVLRRIVSANVCSVRLHGRVVVFELLSVV